MRWFFVAALSFFVLVASLGVLYRAMSGPLRVFASVAGSAPTSTGSSVETAGDFGPRPPLGAPAFSAGISEDEHPVLPEKLHEAIRTSRLPEAPAQAAGPEAPLLVPSPKGAEVDDLAKQLAPALAHEAIDLSAQKSPVMPEVEHELLETWKEQKQILAGQRDTIDTVLHEAQ